MIKLLRKNVFTIFRQYPKNIDLTSTSGTFKSSDLVRQYRKQLLPVPDYNNPQSLPFGKYHTDHMVHVNWDAKTGWQTPRLEPFRDLQLSPFISGFHYGIQCYEGTKAYKNEKGEIRMFRPECNALRFKKSTKRIAMPDFDGRQLLNIIEELVKLESRWIPPRSEYSLYIRPFHFSIDDALGVKKPDKTKLMIVLSPVGPYYATGFKPISLYCDSQSIRSAPKGTGIYKLGGNYGPTILRNSEAEKKGHQQVLWLFGNKVIEVGSSNIFFVFKDKSGQIEVATPEIEDLVLPGVTRDSVQQLLRDQGEYKVSQRTILIDEVIERAKNGQLLQAFGAGTAVLISSVKNIECNGTNYQIPYDKNLNFGTIGYKIRSQLLAIQEGRAQDKFHWVRRLR